MKLATPHDVNQWAVNGMDQRCLSHIRHLIYKQTLFSDYQRQCECNVRYRCDQVGAVASKVLANGHGKVDDKHRRCHQAEAENADKQRQTGLELQLADSLVVATLDEEFLVVFPRHDGRALLLLLLIVGIG